MTLLRLFDRMIEERKSRIGIDVSPTSMSTWHYARLTLGDFVKKKYKMNDIAFGALNEQFIREYQAYTEGERGYSNQTTRHYLALLKKVCRTAYKEGLSEVWHGMWRYRRKDVPSSSRGICSCSRAIREPPMRTPCR